MLGTEQQFAAGATTIVTPQRVIAWSTKDAAAAGNTYDYGFLVDAGVVATVAATGDLFTSPAHGLANGQPVRCFAIERIGTIPGGVTDANTMYYVISAATDSFQLSLTSGGAAIDVTASGICEVCPDRSKEIGADDVFRFLANQLRFQLT